MNKIDTLNLVGTSALFAFAALLGWVALHSHRFHRYGQEALGCAAAWIFIVGTMRCLSLAGVANTSLVRLVNTLSAIVFLIILGELLVLRRVEVKNGALVERRKR